MCMSVGLVTYTNFFYFLLFLFALFERQSPQSEYVGPDISDMLLCPALSLQCFFFFLIYFTVPPCNCFSLCYCITGNVPNQVYDASLSLIAGSEMLLKKHIFNNLFTPLKYHYLLFFLQGQICCTNLRDMFDTELLGATMVLVLLHYW